MAIGHSKSVTIGDFTGTVTVFNSAGVTTTAAATDLVRPADWNSVHAFTQTISGNTAGSSTISGTNLVWAGGNNVTLSASTAANAATITISAANQTVQPAVGQLNGSSGTMSLAVGSSLSAISNASTITFGLASNITTALQSAGAYLTTAALSNHSHNFATTTTNGANIVVGTANSVGATIGVPAYLTTAAQSDHSHGNPTLALTNLTGTTASASNGLTLSLSGNAAQTNQTLGLYHVGNTTGQSSSSTVDARSLSFSGAGIASVGMSGGSVVVSVPSGGGAGDGYNIIQMSGGNSAGTANTYLSATMALYGGNNLTLSQSSNTITFNAPDSSSLVAGANITLSTNGSTISVIGPSAGGVTVSRWWAGLDKGVSSLTSHNATSLNGSMFIQHVVLPCYVTGTRIAQVLGFTAATSHNSANTLTISQSFGVYSRTGPDATQLTLASSGSTTFAATWSSNTTSNAFGMRELYCPINVNMTPGEWFIANVLSMSATNGGSAATFSRFGIPIQTAGGGAADGFTGGTNVSNAVFFPCQGVWNNTTAAMPNSLGVSAITQTGTALMYANHYLEIRA